MRTSFIPAHLSAKSKMDRQQYMSAGERRAWNWLEMNIIHWRDQPACAQQKVLLSMTEPESHTVGSIPLGAFIEIELNIPTRGQVTFFWIIQTPSGNLCLQFECSAFKVKLIFFKKKLNKKNPPKVKDPYSLNTSSNHFIHEGGGSPRCPSGKQIRCAHRSEATNKAFWP